MINKNLIFGNHITAHKLERLIKQQKTLMRSQYQRSDQHHKSRKICKSKSYKMDFNNIFTSEQNDSPVKSPKKPPQQPVEKSPIKGFPSKLALHGIGQSARSFSNLPLVNSPIHSKVQRRWSFYELMSEKQKRLNHKAPKTQIKFTQLMAVKEKKQRLHRMKMQYKFLGKINKNKMRKTRSKSLPLVSVVKIRHTRAKTVSEDFYRGPIFGLDERLNRKIVMLILLKKTALKRHTCFQLPKKSVLVSRERLLKFQKQIQDKLESDTESYIGSPCLDTMRTNRKIYFEEKKQQIKVMSTKKKNLIKALLNKPSYNIINSYISIKAKTQNSLYQNNSIQPLKEFVSQLGDRIKTFHSSQDSTYQKRRPNMLTKLQPYLKKQK